MAGQYEAHPGTFAGADKYDYDKTVETTSDDDSRNTGVRRKRTRTQLDDVDRKIVDLLRKDGRTPAMEIARQLGVSESTVRKRISKLDRENIIQIVATSSMHLLGYTHEMLVSLKTQPQSTRSVIDELKAIERIRYISLMGGPFNVDMRVAFESDRAAANFLVDELAKIEGIVEYNAVPILRVVKRSYDWLADTTN